VTITETSITVGSLSWFYREVVPNNQNDKSPVLLLHGLPAQSYTWRRILPNLAEYGFRAIAPDWIGSGFSAKPEKRNFAYTSNAYLEALSAFLKSLEIGKCSLVVQGFLGSIGLQYALRNRDAIDRLVILNTPLSPTAKLPWQMQQWRLPLIGDMLAQDPILVDRTLEGGSGFVIQEEDLTIYRKPFLTTSASGRALIATTKNLKLSETISEIESGLSQWENPTLILWGMADPWLSSDVAEKLANSRANIELVKLEEAKHYPQEHWSKEVGMEIVNFLRRQM
jgi:pimeloyl-ACP methyl ester carboxylesterase